MKALRQIFLSLVVLAAGLFVWITYVPAARPLLERTGLLDLLGIDASQTENADQGGGRPQGRATSVITASVGEMVREDRITAIGDGRDAAQCHRTLQRGRGHYRSQSGGGRVCGARDNHRQTAKRRRNNRA